MARHAIHSSEMLAMAIETLNSIIQEHEIFVADNAKEVRNYRQTEKDLRYLSTLFKSLHLRSKALEERLRNEINLVILSKSRCRSIYWQPDRLSTSLLNTTVVLQCAFPTPRKWIARLWRLLPRWGLCSYQEPSFASVTYDWYGTEISMWLTCSRQSSARLFLASPQPPTQRRKLGRCLRNSGSIGSLQSL